jgi:hypothetical protein
VNRGYPRATLAQIDEFLPNYRNKEVHDNAIQAMNRTISAELPPNNMEIIIANSTAIISSYLESHPSENTVAPEELKKARSRAIEYAIQGLDRDPSGPWTQLMARPLASLLAALSPQEQRKVLDQLLLVTTKIMDEDLLLSLAQVVEILAEQRVFSDGNQLEVWLTEDQNRRRLLDLEVPANVTVAHLAVARLIAPLVEISPIPMYVVDKLLRIAGVEGSTTDLFAATNALLQGFQQTTGSMSGKSSAQFTITDRLRLGLRGRLLATLVTQGYADKVAFREMVKAIESTTPWRTNSSFAFAQEGLARALTALAPNLQDAEREQALQKAREQLAMTGSTTESAAWSRAIAAVLRNERNDYKFVEQIVEVLKYPTAALIDREPGVSEPRSATDIFVEALRLRLSSL